jgi:hypothetical protein
MADSTNVQLSRTAMSCTDTLAAIVEKLILTVPGNVGRYRSASTMAKCRLPLSTPAQSTCSLLSSYE